MVQLFPSQGSDATVLPGSIDEGKAGPEGSPSADSPRALTALQLALNPSGTVYYGYETYIEDGLICLRHKIRNIEKKKVVSSIMPAFFLILFVDLWFNTVSCYAAQAGRLPNAAKERGKAQSRSNGNSFLHDFKQMKDFLALKCFFASFRMQ